MLGGGSPHPQLRTAGAPRPARWPGRHTAPPPTPEWQQTREFAEALNNSLAAIEAEGRREVVDVEIAPVSDEPSTEDYLVLDELPTATASEEQLAPDVLDSRSQHVPGPKRARKGKPPARRRQPRTKKQAPTVPAEAPPPALLDNEVRSPVEPSTPTSVDEPPSPRVASAGENAAERRQIKDELRAMAMESTIDDSLPAPGGRPPSGFLAPQGLQSAVPLEGRGPTSFEEPPAAKRSKVLRCRSCGAASQWGMCETCSEAFGELRQLIVSLGTD